MAETREDIRKAELEKLDKLYESAEKSGDYSSALRALELRVSILGLMN